MGLFFIVLGLVLWLLVSSTLGILCIIIGLILLFVPNTHGFSDWRARR